MNICFFSKIVVFFGHFAFGAAQKCANIVDLKHNLTYCKTDFFG
jgi:hypothetical protein